MIEKDSILMELKKLDGLPLISAGRVCDLVWFGFGNLIWKEDKIFGNFKEVPEYVLHIQCAWRLTDASKIIVGSADRYIPSTKIQDYDSFDWDVNGANRCDERLRILLETLKHRLYVRDICIDNFGGIKFILNDDILLEVLPDNSNEYEAWRFFKSGAHSEHLVMTGMGANWE